MDKKKRRWKEKKGRPKHRRAGIESGPDREVQLPVFTDVSGRPLKGKGRSTKTKKRKEGKDQTGGGG